MVTINLAGFISQLLTWVQTADVFGDGNHYVLKCFKEVAGIYISIAVIPILGWMTTIYHGLNMAHVLTISATSLRLFS